MIHSSPNVNLDLESIIQQRNAANTSWGNKIARLAGITRHYRWGQMAQRLSKLARARFAKKSIPMAELGGSANLNLQDPSFRQVAVLVQEDHRRRDPSPIPLQDGTIRLLNEERNLGFPLDWRLADSASHLWRFQLHYHEFLLAQFEPRSKDAIWKILESWLDQFATGSVNRGGDAWQPYCISRRLPVWICLLSLHSPSEGLRSRLLECITSQLVYLSKNLERDLGGNHLLENLFALALAESLSIAGSNRGWRSGWPDAFQNELERQLLEHGEHFERSPMYHGHVLGNLLVLLALIGEQGHLSSKMRTTAAKMLGFIRQLLHPDGEIPLFGDSGFDESLSMYTLEGLAKLSSLEFMSQGNGRSTSMVGPYWSHRSGTDFLLVDSGDVAAPYLPAHGHCDLLGLEASVAGHRWFVDSGNFDYEAGSMRQYCRASVAHNVTTLNRADHCDVWSKFRMGRRGQVLSRRSGGQGPIEWLWAKHDLWRKQGVQNSIRFFAVDVGWWLACDFVDRAPNETLEGWLHLSPTLTLKQVSANQFELEQNGVRRCLTLFGCESCQLFDGWYCPKFGHRSRNQVICYRFDKANAIAGWILAETSQWQVETNRGCMRVRDEAADDKQLFSWDFAQCTLS